MYWGIATYMILIIGAGVFLFKDRIEKGLVEQKKLLDEQNKEKTKQPISDVTKQPTPNSSPNGHWHGDEWHDETHTPAEVSTDVQKNRVVAHSENTKIDASNL